MCCRSANRHVILRATGAESLSEKLVSDDRESSRRVRLLILLLVGQISAQLLLFVRVMSYDFDNNNNTVGGDTAQWRV